MMSTAIDDLVAEIEQLDLEGLRKFWGQRYGAPPFAALGADPAHASGVAGAVRGLGRT